MHLSSKMTALKPSDIRVVMKLIAENPGTISLASGSPDASLFPDKIIKKIAHEILTEEPNIALQYGMTLGRDSLRNQIAELMLREGVRTSKDEIIITTGSQQGLSLGAQLFLDPEDIIVTESPSYLGALSAFKPHGANYVGIEGDKYGMDMGKLEELLSKNNRVRAIYIVPNFQNPTGKTWTLERRQALIDMAVKYDLPIIEDNAYGELRYEGERVPSLKSLDPDGRVLYLGSFSKVLSPGLRVGWICAAQKIIEQLELLKYGADLQSVEITQMIVSKFLSENDIDDHLNKIKNIYKKRRDVMIAAIKENFPSEAKFIYPEGGMFVWVELPESIDCKTVLERAVRSKVAFVPGESFYPSADVKNTMRLNFSSMNEDKIKEGICILSGIIKEHIH